MKLLMNVAPSTPNASNFRKPPPGATPRSSLPWLSRSTAVTADAKLQRIVQRRDEHRDTEPQPGGARGGVGQQFQRGDQRCCPDRLLQCPAALEAEFLGAGHVALEAFRVEAVGVALGERDGEPHANTVRPRRPSLASRRRSALQGAKSCVSASARGNWRVGRLGGCSHSCPASPAPTTCVRWPEKWTPPGTVACRTAVCSNSTSFRCRTKPVASIPSR